MPYLLGAAVLLLLVAASRRSSASNDLSLPPGEDSVDHVFNTIGTEAKALPPAAPNENAELQAWVDFYKQKTGRSVALPPELPASVTEYGKSGDVPGLPIALKQEVIASLFEQRDPEALFMLADEVDDAGFPFAANRLRAKAFRMMAGA